ncbi:hypothetical protein ACW4YW_04370 [Methylobacillus pratensis]
MANSAFGRKPRLWLLAVLLMAASGCSSIRTSHEEAMLAEASSLTKLSAAVEATVRYEPGATDMDEQAILQHATAHDPELLNPFKHRLIRVKAEDRHAVLLVCTEDGHRGLLEDAGCNAPLDKHLWQADMPCEFTLQAADACRSTP